MKTKYVLITILIIAALTITACEEETREEKEAEPQIVNNFEECVEKGNPITESYPRRCVHNGEFFTEEIKYDEQNLSDDKYEACEELGGTPLEEHEECENIPKEACEYLEGEFKQCESACRHDPDAEACITLCVPVCVFN